MAAEKKADDTLEVLEEDDEFEEFEDGTNISVHPHASNSEEVLDPLAADWKIDDEDVNKEDLDWHDDWDDEDVNDDFAAQLRAELSKQPK